MMFIFKLFFHVGMFIAFLPLTILVALNKFFTGEKGLG